MVLTLLLLLFKPKLNLTNKMLVCKNERYHYNFIVILLSVIVFLVLAVLLHKTNITKLNTVHALIVSLFLILIQKGIAKR